jgi:hypothetical protein
MTCLPLLRGDQRRQLFRIAFALLQVGGPARLGVELGPRSREQVDHHPVTEACRWRQHQRVRHRHRRIQVDHHARIAGAELAVAVGFHRPKAGGPGRRAQPPGHFGHVDHHPVRIGQRKGAQIHRIGQFDHQPGAVLMLADARAHDDGQRPLRPGPDAGPGNGLGDRLGRGHRQVLGILPLHQLGNGIVGASSPPQRQDGGGNADGCEKAHHQG